MNRPDPRAAAARRAQSRPRAGRRPAAGPRRRPTVRLGEPTRRLSTAVGLLAVVLALMAVRLVQVQGVQAHGYATVAHTERLRTLDLPAARGTIFDRDGQVLARSVEARTITADPMLVADAAAYAHLLSAKLGVDEPTLTARLADRPKRYVVLARDVDPMVWRAVQAIVDPGTGRPITGVFAEPSSKRLFPADELAANILGFLDASGRGAGGIEREFDQILAGRPGKQSFERDRRGNRIATAGGAATEPVAGQDVQLTIDRDIQWTAQQAITAKVHETHAASGTVVVQDVHTGEILAVATYPTFDPNAPGKAPDADRGNRALSQVYEPGSIAKIMTMAALIESGAADAATRLTVPGLLHRAGHVLHDDVAHGTEHLTLAGVLAQSSNIGTVLAADRIGSQVLYRYLRLFGIAQPTGLGFPGESRGILADPVKWSGTQRYTVPFGQGFALNAVQVASIYSTIANGGVRIAPQLVKSWTDATGRRHFPTPSIASRVVSDQTAAEVTRMMEQVVAKGGTAPDVKIDGYRVAGKTGTAQFADSACGCYRGYTASFAGFAPAEAPRIVVSVTLQQPRNGHFGGMLGGPVFVRTMTFALQALGVQPTGTRAARIPITW